MWYAEVDRENWGETEEERAAIEQDMDMEVGDRKQELVLIGQNLQKEKIIEALDACLMESGEGIEDTDDAFRPWPSKEELMSEVEHGHGHGHEHGHGDDGHICGDDEGECSHGHVDNNAGHEHGHGAKECIESHGHVVHDADAELLEDGEEV